MNEIEFYNELVKKTGIAFEKSPIKIKQDKRKRGWNYSVCETPIWKGRMILLGLNWGVENEKDYRVQTWYPKIDQLRDWRFIQSSVDYFEKHLGINELGEINYTNLCFFRSPGIDYLEIEDWKLSLPLLKDYIEYIDPEKVLLLGTTGINKLYIDNALSNLRKHTIKGNKRNAFAFEGLIYDKFKFYCVPHPQSRIKKTVRNEAWKVLFD